MNIAILYLLAFHFLQIEISDTDEPVFESRFCNNVTLISSSFLNSQQLFPMRKEIKEIEELVLKYQPEALTEASPEITISPVAYCVKIIGRAEFLPSLLEECILLVELKSSAEPSRTWCLGRFAITHNDFGHSPGIAYPGDSSSGKKIRYTPEKPSVESIREFISATSFGNQDFTAILSGMSQEKYRCLCPFDTEVLKVCLYPEYAELYEFLRETPSIEVQKQRFYERLSCQQRLLFDLSD